MKDSITALPAALPLALSRGAPDPRHAAVHRRPDDLQPAVTNTFQDRLRCGTARDRSALEFDVRRVTDAEPEPRRLQSVRDQLVDVFLLDRVLRLQEERNDVAARYLHQHVDLHFHD
jgi:hypothetical protein